MEMGYICIPLSLQHICMALRTYLWSNVVRSATKRRRQLTVSDILFAHAKICHFYVPLRIQQNVVQLEISEITITKNDNNNIMSLLSHSPIYHCMNAFNPLSNPGQKELVHMNVIIIQTHCNIDIMYACDMHIPVNDPSVVQKEQSQHNLSSVEPRSVFVKLSRPLDLEHEVATIDVFHHKEQSLLGGGEWRRG